MADVESTCPACGRANVFSEYVAAESRRCTGCGSSLAAPAVAVAEPRMKLHRIAAGEAVTLSGAIIPAAASRTSEPSPLEMRAAAAQDEGTRIVRSPRWLGVLVFLVGAGLFVGAQVLGREDRGILDLYLVARYGLLIAAVGVTLFDAFRESTGQGMLCLLVPFYLVFYALYHVESYWRQGLFLACLAMLGAELHFLREFSLVMIAQAGLNQWAIDVGALIERASDPELK